MELLREEKLRNSNPVRILQELNGGWINRSAVERPHCCHQVYEHHQTKIFVRQKKDDSVIGVS